MGRGRGLGGFVGGVSADKLTIGLKSSDFSLKSPPLIDHKPAGKDQNKARAELLAVHEAVEAGVGAVDVVCDCGAEDAEHEDGEEYVA